MPHQSITDAQRQALRAWFKQQYPKPRQRDCIPWFEKQYNHRLAASTVSDILSDKYSYLDQVRGVLGILLSHLLILYSLIDISLIIPVLPTILPSTGFEVAYSRRYTL